MYIIREIDTILKKQAKAFSAIALTGARQTGKSTLLNQLFGKTHRYISFDNPTYRQQALANPELFLENAGKYVVFDEIQYVPQLMSYLKIEIDNDRQRKGKYLLTGSQQFHLIKNLTESLAGRVGIFNLYPFSVDEFLTKKDISSRLLFEKFALRGAFPELIQNSKINSEIWFASYVQTYLERDVRSVFDIGNLRGFHHFFHLLAARCAQILDLSDLSKEVGVSVNTIKNWLSVLEASQLIYVLPPYFKNFGKRMVKSPKIYFADVGLVCFLTGIKTKDLLYHGPMAGALFENFIVQETIKKFYNSGKRPAIYYMRTSNGVEVDLLIEKNTKLFPFEIKLTKNPTIGMSKGLEQFQKLFSKVNPSKGNIICLSDENFDLSKNVGVMDVKNYLNKIV